MGIKVKFKVKNKVSGGNPMFLTIFPRDTDEIEENRECELPTRVPIFGVLFCLSNGTGSSSYCFLCHIAKYCEYSLLNDFFPCARPPSLMDFHPIEKYVKPSRIPG